MGLLFSMACVMSLPLEDETEKAEKLDAAVQLSNDEYGSKSPINDADELSNDCILGLKHQRFHTPSLNHHVLGLTSGSPINDADELSDDFIFGLLHHAVHGVIGVAHAILGSPINE